MIGCSDIVTLSEDELAALRPDERHADAVRWLTARGPGIIYEALRRIGLREIGDILREANHYGALTSSPSEPAPRHETVLST